MENVDNALKLELLRSYFRKNGLLLCNESQKLPYLEAVGGDWNAIVSLICSGEVFYSKLYKGRVTYLSREFYANIRNTKQRLDSVSEAARAVYGFLCAAKRANTAEIKNTLMLSNKTYSSAMDELFRELLVTALERDRTMNVTWSSFNWCTYEAWEEAHPLEGVELSPDIPSRLTKDLLTEKQLEKLIGARKRKENPHVF